MQTRLQIEEWLTHAIARALATQADLLPAEARFDSLGLDSLSALRVLGELEDWLGVELDPALPYDYPTTRSLATALSALLESGKTTQVAAWSASDGRKQGGGSASAPANRL